MSLTGEVVLFSTGRSFIPMDEEAALHTLALGAPPRRELFLDKEAKVRGRCPESAVNVFLQMSRA